MEITITQQTRTTAEWSEIAKESVALEFIGGVMYAYGSELGCLRLFHKFSTSKARANYSVNLQTWYFSLECPLLVA